MKKVLYIRHGQSETNIKRVFAGSGDNTPLTDIGREQARKAGQELAGQKIDRIISSPLDRTKETAEIIAMEIGFDVSLIQFDSRFLEYDIGSGSGTNIEGMTAKKMVSFPGAENPDVFAERVKKGLLDVAQQDGTTLIVSHGGVGRIIECLRTNHNPAGFYDLQGYPNAHAIELDLSWLQ